MSNDPILDLRAELVAAARRRSEVAQPVGAVRRARQWVRASRRRTVAVAAGVAVLVVPAVAVGTRALAPPKDVGKSPRFTSAPQTDDRSIADALAAFGVLRRPVGAAERDDGPMRTIVRHARRMALEPDAARVVGRSGGDLVWLIPGAADVCVGLQAADRTFGMSCGQDRYALRQGVAVGDRRRIVGVLPDGTKDPRATDANGITTALRVAPGGLFTLPSGRYTVTFDGPHGRQKLQLAG